MLPKIHTPSVELQAPCVMEPHRLWRKSKALHHAREHALKIGHRVMERRREAAAQAPRQAFAQHHSGEAHRAFFHSQIKPHFAQLPEGFHALEVGGGMGLLSALAAAHSTGRILSTELYWLRDSPKAFQHAGTYARFLESEPLLRNVLTVDSAEDGLPLRTHFHPERLQLAVASGHDLPVRSGSMDFVFSLNCLEHIPNLTRYNQESHRVLKLEGLFYNSTQPLYASAFGHHAEDFFPLPWGHLLWPPEEFAELVVRHSGGDREWVPGEPLRPAHLLEQIYPTLNGALHVDFRRALRCTPWKVLGWVEEMAEWRHQGWAAQMELTRAVNVSSDDLQITGLKMLLQKTDRTGYLSPHQLWLNRWQREMGKVDISTGWGSLFG
jgi:SAM-dependent methyltransferase